ncbi:MAG: hypothetical protein KDJ36_14955 [Hyphomicrobiaceae bacterium]|nr:hypothetical protein [Hyphomicrobiaceae bacterium]
MLHQLLWIEALLKFGGGLVLLFLPITTAKILGLPHANLGFWPRLMGALLIGIAGAIYLEGSSLTQYKHAGLGIAGIAVINISGVMGLVGLIIMRLVKTTRGTLVLWLLCSTLLVLILFEIAALPTK